MVVCSSPSTVLPPAPVPEGFFLVQTSPVRGHRYHAGPEWLLPLKPGTPLVLLAEPANPHDHYAVRVQTQEGNHLGYLPRQSNHVVSRLLRQGAPLTGMVADGAVRHERNRRFTVEEKKGRPGRARESSIHVSFAPPGLREFSIRIQAFRSCLSCCASHTLRADFVRLPPLDFVDWSVNPPRDGKSSYMDNFKSQRRLGIDHLKIPAQTSD